MAMIGNFGTEDGGRAGLEGPGATHQGSGLALDVRGPGPLGQSGGSCRPCLFPPPPQKARAHTIYHDGV